MLQRTEVNDLRIKIIPGFNNVSNAKPNIHSLILSNKINNYALGTLM